MCGRMAAPLPVGSTYRFWPWGSLAVGIISYGSEASDGQKTVFPAGHWADCGRRGIHSSEHMALYNSPLGLGPDEGKISLGCYRADYAHNWNNGATGPLAQTPSLPPMFDQLHDATHL